MEMKIEDLIIKSLDQDLNTEEQKSLSASLKDPYWQQEMNKHLLIRQRLKEHQYDFEASFSKRITDRLSEVPIKLMSDYQVLFLSSFKKLAFTSAAVLLLLLGLFVYMDGFEFYNFPTSSSWPQAEAISIAQFLTY